MFEPFLHFLTPVFFLFTTFLADMIKICIPQNFYLVFFLACCLPTAQQLHLIERKSLRPVPLVWKLRLIEFTEQGSESAATAVDRCPS